ncbi:hypothetical protein ACVWWO_003596 [Bradyrhizobium sp. F1.13.1]
MRAIVLLSGTNTKTWPREACATNNRALASIASPSGLLVAKNKLMCPTFATPPSRISGTRQTLRSRPD